MTKKQLAIEARRQYQKQWREKNKEKTRMYRERYWIRQGEKLLKKEDK